MDPPLYIYIYREREREREREKFKCELIFHCEREDSRERDTWIFRLNMSYGTILVVLMFTMKNEFSFELSSIYRAKIICEPRKGYKLCERNFYNVFTMNVRIFFTFTVFWCEFSCKKCWSQRSHGNSLVSREPNPIYIYIYIYIYI